MKEKFIKRAGRKSVFLPFNMNPQSLYNKSVFYFKTLHFLLFELPSLVFFFQQRESNFSIGLLFHFCSKKKLLNWFQRVCFCNETIFLSSQSAIYIVCHAPEFDLYICIHTSYGNEISFMEMRNQ